MIADIFTYSMTTFHSLYPAFNEQDILTLMSNLPVLSFMSWLRKLGLFFANSKVMKMFSFASFLKSYFLKPFTFRGKVYLELTSVYSVRS